MLTDGRRTDDGRTTDARVTGILIAHLRAFSSGELINYRKIVNIFLPISLNIHVLCAQKNRLIETVLLSTCIIYFG